MTDFNTELKKLVDSWDDDIRQGMDNIIWSGGIMDDIHDSVEAILGAKYDIDFNDEAWMDDYYDEIADIIVPLQNALLRRTVENYFGEEFKKKTVAYADPGGESAAVLRECIHTQIKKGEDYQNGKSTVKRSDYFPDANSLMVMMNIKMLRIKSLMESEHTANHEGIEDSLKDLINYASFMVAQQRGKLDD